MGDVTRCVRCVQTEDYPGITFDEEGVCSNCRAFEQRWPEGHIHKTESDFLAILDKARRKGGKYDAIVGLSGGKDSSYVLHLMSRKYKARVLAFTYDNGFLHEGAQKNIELMVKALGVEHRYGGLPSERRMEIYRALFENKVPDLCGPCMDGTIAATNLLALQERVPLVVEGTSSRTENVAIPPSLHNVVDYRYLVDSVQPHLKPSEMSHFKYCDIPWMAYVLFVKRVKYIMLPEYEDWNSEAITDLLAAEYGWIDYGHGVPHFDCCVNAAMDYFAHRRMNTSRMLEQLSQQIRCGETSRKTALEEIGKYHPKTEPQASVDELCKRLDITRDDLKPYLEGKVKSYRDFRGYTKMLQRFSFLFLLGAKLGVFPQEVYRKYRPGNDHVIRANRET